MEDKYLPGFLQEDILVLLCWDKDSSKIIRRLVDIGLFGSEYYRKIAKVAYSFIDSVGEPIGLHLADELDEELNGDGGVVYKRLIDNILLSEGKINKKYTFTKIQKFLKERNLVKAILVASDLTTAGKVEEAEKIILAYKDKTFFKFSSGLKFGVDLKDTFSFLNQKEEDMFVTGVPMLDANDITPGRGELFTAFALSGVGKTWFCINAAKANSLLGHKVLYINLEMPRASLSQRFIQNFYWVAKTKKKMINDIVNLTMDTSGRFNGLHMDTVDERKIKFFNNSKDMRKVYEHMNKYSARFARGQIVIEEFPTGTTLGEIITFIDLLEQLENFVPDIIIVDYPELMRLDVSNYRVSLGETIKGLLGLAKRRNFGLIIPYQSNREGLRNVLWLNAKHLSEDFSVFKHSDVLVSLNQLESEKPFGIIRPYVVKCRNEQDGIKGVITTNYSIGQFCLNCAMMNSSREYIETFRDSTGVDLFDARKKVEII